MLPAARFATPNFVFAERMVRAATETRSRHDALRTGRPRDNQKLL
jgi:hypothetical protein